MVMALTAKVGVDPIFQFGRGEQPSRLDHGSLAMDPFRFNEPKVTQVLSLGFDSYCLG